MSAPYLTAKKRVKYAATGGYRHCSACAMLARPVFDGVTRLQCLQIGVADDTDADVLPGAHCSAWKGRLS